MGTTDARRARRTTAARLSAVRRGATPWAVSTAIAVGGIGALAWVAPRTTAPARPQGDATSSLLSSHLQSEESALAQLEKTLATEEQAVASIGSQPGPSVGTGAAATPTAQAAPVPALAPISLPPPPVHATTGASSAVP